MCAIFSLEILQAGAVKGLFGPPARTKHERMFSLTAIVILVIFI